MLDKQWIKIAHMFRVSPIIYFEWMMFSNEIRGIREKIRSMFSKQQGNEQKRCMNVASGQPGLMVYYEGSRRICSMSFFESLIVVKEQNIIKFCGIPRVEVKGFLRVPPFTTVVNSF